MPVARSILIPRTSFVILVLLALSVGAPSQARGSLVEDHFAPGEFSPFWGLVLSTGAAADQSTGQLVITVPGSGNRFSSYQSSCTLDGAFEAEVTTDLSLSSESYKTGLFVLSPTYQLIAQVTRGPGGYRVWSASPYGDQGAPATLPSTSTLRIHRESNGELRGQYTLDGISWVDIGSPITMSTGPVRLAIGVITSSTTGVAAALDDFKLNSGTLNCPLFNQLCGDGVPQASLGETCDDGNEAVSDGCCACGPDPVAPAPDVSGGWQLTFMCGGAPVATRSFAIAQSPGSATATLTADASECGMISLAGQQRDVTTCSSPSENAQVCGTTFAHYQLDESGAADVTFPGISVNHIPQLAACSSEPVTRLRSRSRFNGTITVDGTTAVRITGPITPISTALYHTGAVDPCLTFAGASCDFEMRRNIATPGTNVTVEPQPGVTVTFSNVGTPTQVLIKPQGAPSVPPPANFFSTGLSSPYMDVSSDVPLTGTATVCFPYTSNTTILPEDLKLYHFSSITQQWEDVTQLPVDTFNHRVCGLVDHLSPFTVGVPEVCGDGYHTPSEACDDHNTNDNDGCSSACRIECGDGTLGPNEACDDGNTTDGDGCSATCGLERCPDAPRGDCRRGESGKSALKFKVNTEDSAKNSLQWGWGKGAATSKSEFGLPYWREDYYLCVYSEGALVSSAKITAGGSCAGKSCWKTGTKGYTFKDKDGASDGITQLQLKEGADGKATVKLKGKGSNLQIPSLNDLADPVEVELRRENGGVCWGAKFSAPFKDQSEASFLDASD